MAVLALVLGVGVTPVAAPPAAAEIVEGPTPWPGGRWQPAEPTYDMVVVSDVQVAVDDGVVLVAEVGYPAVPATGQRAGGTFPVLLTQNPYALRSGSQPDSYFVSRGYIHVVAEVRGTGRSGGDFGFFSDRDAQDGAFLVDWAARLDGSNGVVGLHGCSYLGINQVFTAAALQPNSPVKAILPACGPNQWYGQYLPGGIMFPAAAQWTNPDSPPGIISPRSDLFFKALGPRLAAGEDEAYYRSFWRERSVLERGVAERVVRNNIPALMWSGWLEQSTVPFELYAQFQNAYLRRPVLGPMDSRQAATGRYQIIVGPWRHGQGLDRGIQLAWFDTWLKGEKTGIGETSTPMHLYEMGSERWINVSSYPMVSTYSSYYFGADGALTAGGSLTLSAAAGALGRFGLSPGGASSVEGSPTDGSDALVWAAPSAPGSTLSYTTRPLAGGATLAGPVVASVYASSNNSNVQLIAELFDVAPDGTATRITTGALLGSLRALDEIRTWRDDAGVLSRAYHPFDADDFVPAGQVARYDVALLPRMWSVAPGHSVRLTLSTQAAAGDCASGVPYPCALNGPQQRTVPGGAYQIHRGSLRPSSVNLPLLPFGYFATAASGVTPTSGGLSEPLDWGPPARSPGS
jgi:predicted acyl esterase